MLSEACAMERAEETGARKSMYTHTKLPIAIVHTKHGTSVNLQGCYYYKQLCGCMLAQGAHVVSVRTAQNLATTHAGW